MAIRSKASVSRCSECSTRPDGADLCRLAHHASPTTSADIVVTASPLVGTIVSAAVGQVSSDDLPGSVSAHFPGTPNAGKAQYVSVGLAQDVGFVDFSMSRLHTARVTGIVLGPTSEPAAPGALTLAPSQRSSAVTSVAVGARIAPDGGFVFPNVPQGQYVIQASRGRSNAHPEGEFGAVLVSVTTDVTGVIVRTSSGSSVTGRFRFDVASADIHSEGYLH
jgi:hypothetical protein